MAPTMGRSGAGGTQLMFLPCSVLVHENQHLPLSPLFTLTPSPSSFLSPILWELHKLSPPFSPLLYAFSRKIVLAMVSCPRFFQSSPLSFWKIEWKVWYKKLIFIHKRSLGNIHRKLAIGCALTCEFHERLFVPVQTMTMVLMTLHRDYFQQNGRSSKSWSAPAICKWWLLNRSGPITNSQWFMVAHV